MSQTGSTTENAAPSDAGSGQTEAASAASAPTAAPTRATPAASATAGEDHQGRGHADGPETTEGSGWLSGIDKTRFNCTRNAAYHDERERFFTRLNKTAMFVVVLFGTAAFGTIMQNVGWAMVATFISTLAGVSSLVFEFDTKARLHNSLKGRMFDLLARCGTDSDCQELESEMIRLYAQEPPVKHAVNAVAFNAAVDALGRPPGQKYDLSPSQILLRHWWPYRANEFPTVDERAKSLAEQP